jgi:hypothetical protein
MNPAFHGALANTARDAALCSFLEHGAKRFEDVREGCGR